ncbi:MAG: tripartite tricarboxylate transporter substrate-binding protein, partial [Alphaproteobacteria bacterium]|nr:tripartite tricarboxylate transporter substrate-binding protein [Alphaproteobacteria bacterium]
MRFDRFSVVALGAALVGAAATTAAGAQDVARFYKGKTVTMYIGYSPGGGYDLYGRLVARHIGRHVPGTPTVVAKNMPGAGGLKMANWFYTVAPRNGTAIASAPQAIAIEQALGSKGISYDAAKFNWIGRVTPITEVSYTWHTSPTKTLADARTRVTVMGASGPTSPTVTHLKELNGIIGTKFKPVIGYKGSTGANLAMQRGEVEGATKSWPSMKVANADWVRDKKVNILVQYALEKDPDLPNVPLLTELAKGPEKTKLLRFIAFGNAMGRNVMAPPAVPAARVAALRAALAAMMKDPALLAEGKRLKISLGFMSGEDM